MVKLKGWYRTEKITKFQTLISTRKKIGDEWYYEVGGIYRRAIILKEFKIKYPDPDGRKRSFPYYGKKKGHHIHVSNDKETIRILANRMEMSSRCRSLNRWSRRFLLGRHRTVPEFAYHVQSQKYERTIL